jgi:hypothetical protein
MYKKVYRQEGGLAEEGFRAQIREASRKKIEDFNRRNRGEVAQRVRTPVARFIPQRGSSGLMALPQVISNLKNKNISDILNIEQITGVNKVNKLASDFYDSTKGDEANLARHAAASRELANRLTPDIPGGKYIGNVLSFGGGVAEELSDLGQRGMSYLPAAIEDIKANITGLNYPSGTTPAEIYKDVYKTNNPQDDYGGVGEVINNPYIGASVNSPMWFGGFPLQSGDTLTEKRMRMNRQGFSRPYTIPNNLTLQYNDDGTGTIVSRPADEMETAPGYNTDNFFKALEYYNPNYREQRTNYFKRDDSNQYIIPAGQNTTDFNLLQNYYQGQQ